MLPYLIVLICLSVAGAAFAQPVVPQDERDIARQLVAHDPGLTYAIDQGWLTFQSPIEYVDPATSENVLTTNAFEANGVTFRAIFAYMDGARVAVWFRMQGENTPYLSAPTLSLADESGLPWFIIRAQQTRRVGRDIYGYADFSFMQDQVDYALIQPFNLPYPRSANPAVSKPLQLSVDLGDGTGEISTVDIAVEERPASVALTGYDPEFFADSIASLELSAGQNRLDAEVWTERSTMAATMSRANVCVGWDHDVTLYPAGYIENIGYSASFNLYEGLTVSSPAFVEYEGRRARCMIIEASVPANYRNNFALIVVTGWTDDVGVRYSESLRVTLEIGYV